MSVEYLTFAQVRELTGLGKNSLYAELQSGRLRSFRPGPGHWRYKVTRQHVEDYLKRATTVEEEDLHSRANQHRRPVGKRQRSDASLV